MAPTFDDLAADLRAETALIVAMIDPLTEEQWRTPTPAPGWTIADQVAHLAFFDDMATLAATDPDAFREQMRKAELDPAGVVDRAVREQRDRSADDVYAWFVQSREALVVAFASLPEGARVPWYGPEMSATSKLTARVMETWAHGYDIADALHVAKPPTRALRNVAHIGVRTMANSFRTVGLAVPELPVFVVLTASDGTEWTWGSADAADSIRGNAVEFCLVATQRRHIDDTSLDMEGLVAQQWMRIAQAFAGPPGAGREPGQFAE